MDGQEYHTLSDSKFVEISNDDLIEVSDAVAGTIYIKKKDCMSITTKDGSYYIFKEDWEAMSKWKKHGK